MKTLVKDIKEILTDHTPVPDGWGMKAIMYDDNMSYIAFNEKTKEALFVDPVREDWETQRAVTGDLRGYRWIAVIDTHTHADHVSNAAQLAEHLSAPLIQHAEAPSARVHLRISRETRLSTAAGPLEFLLSPGHTHDCITPIWGPFVFGGDNVLYGDTGRDDLPTGDPEAHWESLKKLKSVLKPEMILLPGHDDEHRACSWKTQLKINEALNKGKKAFVEDEGAYVAPAPRLLKESLYENFK